MTPNEYQNLASKTAGNHDKQYFAMGLAGEAGEFNNKSKKWLYHGHAYDSELFKDELGDVLWYVAMNALQHGLSLEEIMEYNVAKLKARYPEGFSTERSVNREK